MSGARRAQTGRVSPAVRGVWRGKLGLVAGGMGAGSSPDDGFLDDLAALGPLDLNIAPINHRHPTVFAHAPVQDGLSSVDESGHRRLILGVKAVGLVPGDVHLATSRLEDAEISGRGCGPTCSVGHLLVSPLY